MAPRKSPDAFRTISEVADWLGVSAHVLRFWESKFSQVRPVKRAGGRRYYRVSDMELLGGIKKLLHEDGMTIKGAQKILREKGVKAVAAMSRPVSPPGLAEALTGADADAMPMEPAEISDETPAVAEGAHPVGAQGTGQGRAAPPADAQNLLPGLAEAAAPLSASPDAPATPEPPSAPGDPAPAEDAARLPTDEQDAAASHEEEPLDNLFVEPTPAHIPDPVGPRASDPGLGSDVPSGDRDLAVSARSLETVAPGSSDANTPMREAHEPGPEIAPLPGEDLSLTEILQRLQPGQIPRSEIIPLLARARALRRRMGERRP
ncbi:MAG: MerR family transcriptional regulator [Pseudomonadota bacterium]